MVYTYLIHHSLHTFRCTIVYTHLDAPLFSHKLSLNVQKTYFMVFHRAKIIIVTPINVTMNNCCLKKTDSLKYLGVIIDHRLNWSQHITHVKNIRFPKALESCTESEVSLPKVV